MIFFTIQTFFLKKIKISYYGKNQYSTFIQQSNTSSIKNIIQKRKIKEGDMEKSDALKRK